MNNPPDHFAASRKRACSRDLKQDGYKGVFSRQKGNTARCSPEYACKSRPNLRAAPVHRIFKRFFSLPV
ncbi:MAG TPA: hypothetical protein DDX86_09480 [Akkermansia sp.]|nr:hypothetical protein [Akkermansia sp.]